MPYKPNQSQLAAVLQICKMNNINSKKKIITYTAGKSKTLWPQAEGIKMF